MPCTIEQGDPSDRVALHILLFQPLQGIEILAAVGIKVQCMLTTVHARSCLVNSITSYGNAEAQLSLDTLYIL